MEYTKSRYCQATETGTRDGSGELGMGLEMGPQTLYLLTMNQWTMPEKRATSKIVLGWTPLPIQEKNAQVNSNNITLGESNMIMKNIINDALLWTSRNIRDWR